MDDENVNEEAPSTSTSSAPGSEPDFLTVDSLSNEHEVSANTYEVNGEVSGTATATVKGEVEIDDAELMMGISRALASVDPYRPRGRPRGPKHPVWNFFRFCRTGGVTLGYMCLLCGSDFTGPANTTNATKHLRCRHKNEYMAYLEVLENSKQGTFSGNISDAVRQILDNSRANPEDTEFKIIPEMLSDEHRLTRKRSRTDSGSSPSEACCDTYQEPQCKNLASSFEPSSSTKLLDVEEVSTSSAFMDTLRNENLEDADEEKPILSLSENTRNRLSQSLNSVGGSEFVDQMESFIHEYRRLEAECRSLRLELKLKDDHIAALRMRLLEEQNKRKNALVLVQRALLDDTNDD